MPSLFTHRLACVEKLTLPCLLQVRCAGVGGLPAGGQRRRRNGTVGDAATRRRPRTPARVRPPVRHAAQPGGDVRRFRGPLLLRRQQRAARLQLHGLLRRRGGAVGLRGAVSVEGQSLRSRAGGGWEASDGWSLRLLLTVVCIEQESRGLSCCVAPVAVHRLSARPRALHGSMQCVCARSRCELVSCVL